MPDKDEKKMTIKEFAILCGIPPNTVYGRLNEGWSIQDAVRKMSKSDAIKFALQNMAPRNRSTEIREKIISMLPASTVDLADKFHLTRDGVVYHMRVLKREGRIHIGGWRRCLGKTGGGGFSPIWHEGEGEDVPCKLKPLTTQKIQQRKKEKARRLLRADPLAQEKLRAKAKMRTWLKQARATGFAADPLQAAFFGRKAA